MRPIPATLLAAAAIATTEAQVLTTPSTTTSSPGTTTVVNRQQPKSDKPFLGTDVPVFNPGTEMFSWDGQNWNINNNRLLRARFEKYLNTPEDDNLEDEKYRAVIKQVLDELSPHKRGSGHLQRAVALLPRASRYRIDANLCDSLSQAILGVYHGQKNAAALASANLALDNEGKKLHWNVEVDTSKRVIDKTPRENKGGQGGQPDTGKSAADAGRVASYLQRLVEIKAMKVANNTKIGISELQAKIEYQALILQFAVQRRWEHVLMATRIYRRLFNDGDGSIEIKEGSDADKMLAKGLGVSPTVTSLDMFANEVVRDVDEGVRAFEYLVEKNEMEGASKHLAAAFFVGEYLPRIRTLERNKKQKVLRFVQDADALLSAMEVRDYATADEVVDRMRTGAKDFNFSKAKAGIQFYTNLSNTSLAQAKIAGQKGEMEEYQRQMRMAIEAWPLNPRIKEQNDLFASVADVQVTTINELDSLLSQGNHREIMKQQGRFIAAVQSDPQRKEQLEKALVGMMDIRMAMAKIKALADAKNPWGAWEAVRQARGDFGNDRELLILSENISEDVSSFISVIKKAERLEEQSQTGLSLTWYLKARRMYPNSIFAQEGIDRLVEEILPAAGTAAPNSDSETIPQALDFE